jgi:putative endonuclease
MANHLIIGNAAEALAKEYLMDRGLKWLKSQFRTPLGEIDLIMQDKNELVFVEVRCKESNSFCEPYETVTRAKQKKIIRTAQLFLKRHPRLADKPCRFDVISVSGTQLNLEITWIPDAFCVE